MRFPLWGRKRRNDELNEEIQAHLTLAAREEQESGQSRKDAQIAARHEFGNVAVAQEVTRDMWGWRWFADLLQDVRYGLRMLRKNPGFTAVCVLTLALGIGANTAIFSLVDTVMLRMLPVQNPEGLMQVSSRAPKSTGSPNGSFTNILWEQVRDRQGVFSGIFAWSTRQFDLAQGGESHNVPGLYISGDYFKTLGVRAAAGRLLNSSDDKRGCAGAAVLSYGFWQEHYGGAPSAVGSMINLDSHPFQVVGVSATGFFGLDVGLNFDVAIPVCAEAIMNGKNSMLDHRSAWWLRVMGRARPGMGLDQVNTGLQVISPGTFAAAIPPNWKPDMQKNFSLRALVAAPAGRGLSWLRRSYEQPLKMLMVIVGLVLLIACANIASLMLSRAAARRQEISIRLAVGASRARLIRQLLTECILLSFGGASLGILFARWGSALLTRFISTSQDPVFLDLSLNPRILGFTAAAAVLTGLLFGVIPAFRSTRVSLAAALKGGQGDTIEGRAHFRPGRWIVASQVALSLVLVIVAGLFLHSFNNLVSLDVGFDRTNVLLISANVHNALIAPDQRAPLFQQILDRLKALPGAISASESVLTPIGNSTWNDDFFPANGKAFTGSEGLANVNFVSPDYFATLRSPILAGRNFDDRDSLSAPLVAIVNETMARKFFPLTEAIGQFIRIDDRPGQSMPPMQIVGILKDAKYNTLREATIPTIYFPFAQLPDQAGSSMTESPQFEIRTASRPSSLAAAAAENINGINKAISLEFHTLQEQVDDSLLQDQLLATLSGFFGGLALLLAMIGLYGVLAYMVTQRRKEIGIRMALGAGRGSIMRLILRDVSILLLIGVAAGVGISWWATRLVEKMLFDLAARDAKTILLAVLVLSGVALFAGYWPARRASRLNPMSILRDE